MFSFSISGSSLPLLNSRQGQEARKRYFSFFSIVPPFVLHSLFLCNYSCHFKTKNKISFPAEISHLFISLSHEFHCALLILSKCLDAFAEKMHFSSILATTQAVRLPEARKHGA
jgi:hypothetical protein